jgi:DNA-binding response OmpR family regulator
MAAINILIVEDELIIAEELKINLTRLGYNVRGIVKTTIRL